MYFAVLPMVAVTISLHGMKEDYSRKYSPIKLPIRVPKNDATTTKKNGRNTTSKDCSVIIIPSSENDGADNSTKVIAALKTLEKITQRKLLPVLRKRIPARKLGTSAKTNK